MFRLAVRSVVSHPARSTVLVCGFGVGVSVMANLLGRGSGGLDAGVAAALEASAPGIHPHLYGKTSRDGRKIGHVTALGEHPEETRARALNAAETLMAATARTTGAPA